MFGAIRQEAETLEKARGGQKEEERADGEEGDKTRKKKQRVIDGGRERQESKKGEKRLDQHVIYGPLLRFQCHQTGDLD